MTLKLLKDFREYNKGDIITDDNPNGYFVRLLLDNGYAERSDQQPSKEILKGQPLETTAV